MHSCFIPPSAGIRRGCIGGLRLQSCSAAESQWRRQTPPHLPELKTLWHPKRPLLTTHFFPLPLLSPYKYLVILTVTVPVEQRCPHSFVLVS